MAQRPPSAWGLCRHPCGSWALIRHQTGRRDLWASSHVLCFDVLYKTAREGHAPLKLTVPSPNAHTHTLGWHAKRAWKGGEKPKPQNPTFLLRAEYAHPGPLTLFACWSGVFKPLSQESWTVKIPLYQVPGLWFQHFPCFFTCDMGLINPGPVSPPRTVIRIKQSKNGVEIWKYKASLHFFKWKQSTFCFWGGG